MGAKALSEQCSCVRGPSDSALYKDFYSSMKIRTKPHQDLFELIRSKKSGSKDNLSEKKWLIIKECFLINEEKKEAHLSFWDKVVTFSRDKSTESTLYLCLLFLCEDNINNFVKYFLDMINEVCMFDTEQIKDKTIKRSLLENMLMLYLNIITQLGMESIKKESNNQELFEDKYSKLFTEENLNDYLKTVLLKGVNDKDEWVNYEEYFNEKYDLIRDDNRIREDISRINEQKEKSNETNDTIGKK